MAFICEPCHVEVKGGPGWGGYGGIHWSGSYGPCEICGKTKECHDCRCQSKASSPSGDTNPGHATTQETTEDQ